MSDLSTAPVPASPPGGSGTGGDGSELDAVTPPSGTPRSAARRDLFRYVAGRVSGALVSMVLVLLSAFFIFRVIGGDPVRAIGGDSPMTPEQRAEIEERLGLNEPMTVQFWEYVKDLFTLDWGQSYVSSAQVTDLMWDRLPNTLLLTATALVLAAGLGVWIGARAGWKQGTTFEKTQVGISLTLWSAPTFWLGMIVIIVFSVELDLFPVNGMRSARGVDDGFFPELVDIAHHL
ncbi:ABC transporter permease, partial [Phytoactinopolyspora endophytica]|uniref:ABC transporter permease n=1 Tax=Phytoactinopolyspora endophytica TaxID=1642495 RepID=UPI00197B9E11